MDVIDGITIAFSAHASVINIKDPVHDSYSKIVFGVHKYALNVFSAWADMILFGTEDIHVNNETKKAIGVGERIVYTDSNPSFIAKNRDGLPSKIKISKENGGIYQEK